jgi:hypothetical protein
MLGHKSAQINTDGRQKPKDRKRRNSLASFAFSAGIAEDATGWELG